MVGPPRVLAVATAAYVLGLGAQSTLLFFLVPAATRATGSTALDGVAFVLTALAAAAASIPAGRLADRAARRTVMRLGLAAAFAALLVLGVAPAAPTIVFATALAGAGVGAFHVAFMSYVADVLLAAGDRARLAATYGATSALALAACALGPFLAAGLVASAGDDLRLGVVWTALALAAVAGVALLLTTLLPSARRFAAPAPRRRGLPTGAALFAAVGLPMGVVQAWSGPHLLDGLGATAALWGVALGVATAASAPGNLLAGRLARRFEAGAILLGANVATGVSIALFGVVGGLAEAAILLVARNFLAAIANPAMNALVAASEGNDTRGGAIGAAATAWHVAWAAGALAGGLLLESFGGATFVVAGVAVAVGTWAAMRGRPAKTPSAVRAAAP